MPRRWPASSSLGRARRGQRQEIRNYSLGSRLESEMRAGPGSGGRWGTAGQLGLWNCSTEVAEGVLETSDPTAGLWSCSGATHAPPSPITQGMVAPFLPVHSVPFGCRALCHQIPLTCMVGLYHLSCLEPAAAQIRSLLLTGPTLVILFVGCHLVSML